MFSVDGTDYYQGTWNVANDLIGTEVYETQSYNVGSIAGCDTYRCKYTDILLAPYDDVNHWLGYLISKPTNRVKLPTLAGSTTITTSGTALITMIHEVTHPIMGDTLDKIGKERGWTAGSVTAACEDILVHTSFIEFLCQYSVAAGNDDGDSGSAVFYYTPTGDGVGTLSDSFGAAKPGCSTSVRQITYRHSSEDP